ncbi:MAG TPA: long-chain fatty acid--CoA ligase, partial [Halobacteria archaeon]|nr:long-chain fatty acid--CoA ligase [Halobacteria archaeon]
LPDGGIRILDRVKDAIKSGGEWIPTSILESVISEINGVELVAVVGRQDEKWGERPIAFIVGSITEEEIKDYLNRLVEDGKIAKWWIPDEIKFLDEMPLTGTGKINKIKLREYLKNI